MPTQIALATAPTALRPLTIGRGPAALLRLRGADIALLAVVAAAVVLGIAAMADVLAAPVALDALSGFSGL